MQVLHHLLRDEALPPKIEEILAKLRQDQYGREDSVDNGHETTILHHITKIMEDPDKWDAYLKNHNPPLHQQELKTNTGIAAVLASYAIINTKTYQKIKADERTSAPQLRAS